MDNLLFSLFAKMGCSRYYLSSLSLKAKELARIIRGHWAREDQLHWERQLTVNDINDRKIIVLN
jgi:predicted transposase YbfD/YdcC